MNFNKYYIIGIIAVILVGGGVWYTKYSNQNSNMQNFTAGDSTTTIAPTSTTNDIPPQQQTQKFCPDPETLVKVNNKWATKDAAWQSYTPSIANAILTFLGAQWVGIQMGQIICLYQTNDKTDFPVSLEPAQEQLVIEPKTSAWSARVDNRRFCKSASTADCVYFVKTPAKVKDIYQEISYNPSSNT